MTAQAFRVSLSRPQEGVALVSVVGEVDLCSSISLREQLNRALEDGVKTLIIDAALVPFMDSSALGCLVAAERRGVSVGCRLILVVGERVRRILNVAGIDRVLPVCESVREALELSTHRS